MSNNAESPLVHGWRQLSAVVHGRAKSNTFFRELPVRSQWTFILAVGATFAPMGFIVDLLGIPSVRPWWAVGVQALLSAVLAGGLASFVIVERSRPLGPLIAVLASLTVMSMDVLPPGKELDLVRSMDPLRFRIWVDCAGILTTLMLGYGLFVWFIQDQGIRGIQYRTEIQLAAKLHRALVPEVHESWPEMRVYGISRASSDVGGDLVDLCSGGGERYAYVADVSGHGVGAGALMGMFKSAFRTRLAVPASMSEVVGDLNAILIPLKPENMFVTFAGVRVASRGQLEFCSAGHVPGILCRQKSRQLEYLESQQAPLGLFDGLDFPTSLVTVEPGDVLMIVTDGLVEAENSTSEEFGMERLGLLLTDHIAEPLPQLAEVILAAVGRHGEQEDDQSLLLLRIQEQSGDSQLEDGSA